MKYTESSSVVVKVAEKGCQDFYVMSYPNASIIHVTDESVIEEFSSAYEGDGINEFIKSVIVSIVKGTMIYFDNDDTPVASTVNRKLLFFTETANDENFEIEDESLCDILTQFPKFALADDGLMVFYTPEKMVATYDCKTCVLVNASDEKLSSFNSISVNDEGTLIVNATSSEYKVAADYDIIPEFLEYDKPLLDGIELFIIP